MRCIILLFLCLLISTQSAYSQPQYLDSLRHAFQIEKDPLHKIDIFYEIANELSLDNPAVGFAYADSLEWMAKKASYKKGTAMSKHLRGFAFDDQGEYEKALALFQEELAIFTELKDRKEQSTAFTNIGNVWGNMGKADSSIVYYLKALSIDNETGEQLGASIIHNNIGNIYSAEGAYKKAIEHFEKALKIRQEMGAEKRYMQCYSNLATVYSRMSDYQKAEEYSRLGLEIALKYDNKAYAGIIVNSLGSSYNDQNRFQEAIPWLDQALAYWKMIGNEDYQTYALYNLTISHAGLRDGVKALAFAKQGYEIVERLSLEHQRELYYKAFAQAYEANGDMAQAFGWHKKYVALADSIFKLDNTEKVAQIEAQFETQKKEAQLAKQQLQLERETGQKKTILLSALMLILILSSFFLFFRNKNRIKQKEAELSAQLRLAESEKLRELDNIKSIFFANISHEFRTPLTLILSPMEQMIKGTFTGDTQRYYRIIYQNGKRLLDLVNQLLDLSKLESGKLKLQVSEGDLGRFVNAVAGSFESLAERRQIHFEINVPSKDSVCFFDKDKVQKVLANLLSNAFKFTHPGDRVSVRVALNKGHVTIIVSDSGMGIPSAQLPQLFERFAASSPSEVQAGSGIGLALAKELTELHGGTLSVKSENQEGSVFTVSFPISKDSFTPEQIVESKDSLPVSDFAASLSSYPEPIKSSFGDLLSTVDKPLLLLVEDNVDLRAYIADTMRNDFQIIEAENGKVAIEKAIEITPDLVISDVMMPEMDGITFCKLLKTNEKTSHVPIILLTARAEQADKLEGLHTGADDYLIKPFDARELLIRATNLITQRKKLQDLYRSTLHTFSPADVKIDSMDAIFLQKIKDTVEASLEDENFSVVQLGHKIGMSRSQLHRKLSALTGFSPNEVIRNMRLERAKQLLEKKVGTVSEIAYLCGFSSPAYFIKCFKDYFGSTPGQTT